ncbi:josephin-like protein [Plakobranchus ocellatus]|uniref:Josephin-2 n=1 Tax=Plakobranchus ocellatus TaxID=259542 RepID=A0AAV4DC60_9GAST|nr:josephin-like protein [Plakobranchus ocellatus]
MTTRGIMLTRSSPGSRTASSDGRNQEDVRGKYATGETTETIRAIDNITLAFGMNSNDDKSSAEGKLYHEKQVKAMCALHALNNLFQRNQTFTKKDLDQICDRLSPGTLINPHRSMLGLGNYDVNVLMAALQEKGYETIWFDKRKNVDVLEPGNIMGFILNTPSAYRFGPLKLALHCKHWIALRRLKGQYMNLDSKLSTPATIGDQGKLLDFLRAELEDGKKELLLVVEREVYETSTWRKYGLDEEEEQDDKKENEGIASVSCKTAATSESGQAVCTNTDELCDAKTALEKDAEASSERLLLDNGEDTEESESCRSNNIKQLENATLCTDFPTENTICDEKIKKLHVLNGNLPNNS